MTMNFDAYYGEIYSENDLIIDQSKIEISDSSEDGLWIGSDYAGVTISESDINLGSGYDSGICAWTTLTIDNSNISVTFTDDPWFDAIHSHGGDIVLKNMENGEIVYADDGNYAYVSSGDEDGVFLKAASTPGYYKDAEEETPAEEPAAKPAALPNTGDALGMDALVGFAALAACALAVMVIARRRVQD